MAQAMLKQQSSRADRNIWIPKIIGKPEALDTSKYNIVSSFYRAHIVLISSMTALTNTTASPGRKSRHLLPGHVVKARLLGLRSAAPEYLQRSTRRQIASGERVKFQRIHHSTKVQIKWTQELQTVHVEMIELLEHIGARDK